MESPFRIRRSGDHLYDLEKLGPRNKTQTLASHPPLMVINLTVPSYVYKGVSEMSGVADNSDSPQSLGVDCDKVRSFCTYLV